MAGPRTPPAEAPCVETQNSFRRLVHRTLGDMRRRPRKVGLVGSAGDTLFACAVARCTPGVDAAAGIARAEAAINTHGAHPGLHRGLAGIGLVLATYGDDSDSLTSIDVALLDSLAGLPPASVQGGIAGIALYASLRSDHGTGRMLQAAVLDALAASAISTDGGVIWHTPPWYARARGIAAPSDVITEFGAVHGIAGALVALAALAEQGHREAGDLARLGLSAAWSHHRPGANGFGRIEFGHLGADGIREYTDRRWCVGDHGVLRALWITATTMNDLASAERALHLLRETAASDSVGEWPGAPGRVDLCCGLAVIAQVYTRMHKETGEEVFLLAQRRLFAECAKRVMHLEDPSFAYGRAGVILAMLAAEAHEEPLWDGMLGLSLPRRLTQLG